jgi:solute carrier family 25 phosphate transporter 23/24/25/41
VTQTELHRLQELAGVKAEQLREHKAAVARTMLQLAAGGAAGTFARTTVAPFDVVKIRMQVAHVQNTTHLYPSMAKTFAHIVRNEGVSGLWRGNLVNCVRVAPHSATQFVTQVLSRRACGSVS